MTVEYPSRTPARTPGPLQRSRSRALNRLGAITAMGLGAIGDIGSASFGTVETLTWSTATEWDNAVSEAGIAHEDVTNTDYNDASVVRQGYSYQNPLHDADLSLFAPMDEDSGSTSYDFSGNNRDGSINGATIGVSEILGTTGYDLDGTDDYIDWGDMSELQSPSAVTVATFINPDTTSYSDRGSLVYKGGSGDDNFGLWIDGNLTWYADSGGGSQTTTSISTGTWTMIVAVFDGGNQNNILYKNGTQVDSANTSSGTLDSNTNPVVFGRRGDRNERYYDGQAGITWIWNRVLTSSEISTLWDVTRGGNLTSATKSFSSSTQPDLVNLDYTLNAGTLSIDVIGSPGTADEEIQNSGNLDGTQTAASLTWNSGHTDFRVKPLFDTSGGSDSPATVNRIALQ